MMPVLLGKTLNGLEIKLVGGSFAGQRRISGVSLCSFLVILKTVR